MKWILWLVLRPLTMKRRTSLRRKPPKGLARDWDDCGSLYKYVTAFPFVRVAVQLAARHGWLMELITIDYVTLVTQEKDNTSLIGQYLKLGQPYLVIWNHPWGRTHLNWKPRRCDWKGESEAGNPFRRNVNRNLRTRRHWSSHDKRCLLWHP